MIEKIELKFQELENRIKELENLISSPDVISNLDLFKKYSKEYSVANERFSIYKEYKKISGDILNINNSIVLERDPEMIAFMTEELNKEEKTRDELFNKLKTFILPKSKYSDKNTIVEIRAGTGGEEASLFANDLFRMYSRFAERKKWDIEILDSNATELGGLKEIIFLISGYEVYNSLRFESGTHRVQRVPTTESGGRVHTSAATVAVLPEAEDVDVEIKPDDIRIDTFCSSGKGGQGVNTTKSAIRITHIPTGLVVSCQDERSQLKNKNKGMKVLKSRLLDLEIQKQNNKLSMDRKNQVGTGDRSEKIRTYNFPQDRVTDHRIGFTRHNLYNFLDGEIDDLLDALNLDYQNSLLNDTAK